MRLLTTTTFVIVLCISVFAQSAGDFYRRASKSFNDKDYPAAIEDYTRALQLDSTSAVLYNNRGVCYYRMQMYQNALSDYNNAIRLKNSYADAFYNKGNVLVDIVMYADALMAFDQAITLKPNKKYFMNRGLLRNSMKNFKGAVEDFTEVIRIQPTDPRAYNGRGSAYLNMSKYQKALHDFDLAISLDPSYYKAYINRGVTYTALNQVEAAKRDFTLAARFNSLNGEAYYYRGMATLTQMGAVNSNKKNRRNSKMIHENVFAITEACSDFEKAAEFRYPKAYEAIETFCKK